MLAVTTTIIDRMSKRFPKMTFHLMVESTHVLLRDLRERAIELVISRMLTPIADDDLSVTVLFHNQLAIIAGRDNPLARRKALKLEQLIDEPWVLPPSDGWLHPLLQKAFAAHRLDVPNATVSTLSTYAVSMLVAQGPYLTVHPETMLRTPGPDTPLRALPVPLPETRGPVGLVTLKHHALSPVAKVFLETTRAVVKDFIGPVPARRSLSIR
jgi:DNA-binding transcriptional LysR family regulator